jgi:hypothetical protein
MRLATKILLLSTLLYAGCSPGDLENPYFDEWCGELPCGWQLDVGAVARVSTWHEKDYGAELVGAPAQLSQRGIATYDCLRIELVARGDSDASLLVSVDFEDDGSIDYDLPIPTAASDWQRHTFDLRIPLGYGVARYALRKTGLGRAVVGKLSARAAWGCTGERLALRAGATCSSDLGCKSGRCHDGSCGGCAPGMCAEGERCNDSADCMGGGCAGGLCRACAAEASCGARESCTSSSQCASGLCVGGSLPSLTIRTEHDAVCAECTLPEHCPAGRCTLGMCGECASDADCGGGLVCRHRDPYEASGRACLPRLTAKLARGQLCDSDDECEAGLPCGAAAGRAKRCGISCASDDHCDGGVCAMGGSRRLLGSFEPLKLPSFERGPSERVATCYRLTGFDGKCAVHAQCSLLRMSCCSGSCSDAGVERVSGTCSTEIPIR